MKINRAFSTTTSNVFYQSLVLAIFITSFVTLGFLFAVNQKGFDINDEGFHLLVSQYPGDVVIWSNVAHVYTAIMYSMVGDNIVALRIFSEVLLFLSASLFFYGVYRLASIIYRPISRDVNLKIVSWSTLCLGALFYYIQFDTTPSYNTLNAICLNAASGLFCMSLASLSVRPAKLLFALISSLAAGMFIGICLLVKFPTAIMLTMLFALTFMVWPQVTLRHRVYNGVAMLFGTLAWFLFHIAFLQSLSAFWTTMSVGIPTFLKFGLHNPHHCFAHYFPETFHMLESAIQGFWKVYVSFILLGVAAWLLMKKAKFAPIFFSYGFIAILLFACYTSIQLLFYRGGSINSLPLMDTYTSWLLLFICSSLSCMAYLRHYSLKLLILALFFLALPFAGAIGTANDVTLNLTQYMEPWFAFMLLALLLITYTYDNRWIYLIGALILSLFAANQIISAGFIAPYNLRQPIGLQTEPTPIGVPTTYLKLDKETSDFFKK